MVCGAAPNLHQVITNLLASRPSLFDGNPSQNQNCEKAAFARSIFGRTSGDLATTPSFNPMGILLSAGPHPSGLAGEYGREQGWQTNEAECTESPEEQDSNGGKDYDYGTRNFSDSTVDTSKAQSPAESARANRSPPAKKP